MKLIQSKMNHLVLLTLSLSAFAASASAGCTCGQENLRTRIVNGKEAQKDRYPWMVSVLIGKKTSPNFSTCGGSLINDRYILTAAHCLDHKDMDPQKSILMLGAHNHRERFRQIGQQEKLQIEKIILHEKYRGREGGYLNDIGLIKLKNPVNLGGKWNPVCLPNFSKHSNLFVYGWGDQNKNNERVDAEVIHEKEIDEVDNSTCIQKYWGRTHVPEQRICAGTTGSTCSGDSGGPVSTRQNGNVYQVGIVSIGTAGCGIKESMKPRLSERVTYHMSWIEKHTQDAQWCSAPDVPDFIKRKTGTYRSGGSGPISYPGSNGPNRPNNPNSAYPSPLLPSSPNGPNRPNGGYNAPGNNYPGSNSPNNYNPGRSAPSFPISFPVPITFPVPFIPGQSGGNSPNWGSVGNSPNNYNPGVNGPSYPVFVIPQPPQGGPNGPINGGFYFPGGFFNPNSNNNNRGSTAPSFPVPITFPVPSVPGANGPSYPYQPSLPQPVLPQNPSNGPGGNNGYNYPNNSGRRPSGPNGISPGGNSAFPRPLIPENPASNGPSNNYPGVNQPSFPRPILPQNPSNGPGGNNANYPNNSGRRPGCGGNNSNSGLPSPLIPEGPNSPRPVGPSGPNNSSPGNNSPALPRPPIPENPTSNVPGNNFPGANQPSYPQPILPENPPNKGPSGNNGTKRNCPNSGRPNNSSPGGNGSGLPVPLIPENPSNKGATGGNNGNNPPPKNGPNNSPPAQPRRPGDFSQFIWPRYNPSRG